MPLRVPVALLVFNRPDLTERVFAAIAAAQPETLLVVSDGPRADREGEAERVAASRAILDRVDWPCTVLRNFADANMGCKRRVASGLDWVFQTVERAIILEDDCLPDPTFFPYCEELLNRYSVDERVMAITGDNFQGDRQRTAHSYYFSKFPHIWGWATWRRAWQLYDVEMKLWPTIRDDGWLLDILHDRDAARFFYQQFDAVYGGGIDTWDYAWIFSCWLQSGLTIVPTVNLVSNIGFRSDATHTHVAGSLAELPVRSMSLPLIHPPFVVCDQRADAHTARQQFAGPSLASRIRGYASGRFRRMLRAVRGARPTTSLF